MKQNNLKKTGTVFVLGTGLALGLFACSTTYSGKSASTPTADGEVAVPGDYRSWPKFVSTIDKPNGQIREIYINDTGMKARKGSAFPTGTVTVMEIYTSKKGADGKPSKNGDGRMTKEKLSKVFVMQKEAGVGQKLPDGVISNGDWLYGAYEADGKTAATNDFTKCRGCHAPLADDDYIARYDEHFKLREAAGMTSYVNF